MAGRSRTNVPATVYKGFQPQIDRKEEQGANILAIHLPDFPKEQLNVTYVDASRTIKVQAEKAMAKNTRSRFNQDFPVPENCIIEKIQASFRNGILTITMPKRIITRQLPLDSPKQITPTTPAASSSTSAVPKQRDQRLQTPPKPRTQPKPPMATEPKPTAEPKPPTATEPKPTAEPKPPMATPTAPKPISEPRPTMAQHRTEPKPPMATPIAPKPTSEPRPPMATVEKPITEPKPPMVTAPQIPKQQTEGKEVEALPPLKQQEEIQRKVSAIGITKQTEEERAGGSTSKPEILEKEGETKDGLKDLVDEKAKDSAPKAADIPKTSSVKADGVEKMPKEGGGFLEMTGMDTIMKTVKRLATDDAEDRQLLINIGVSVLVIVALGAYITYSYRSSGKAKN